MKEKSACIFKVFFNSKRIAKLRSPGGLTITKDIKLQLERLSNNWDCNLFLKFHYILLISVLRAERQEFIQGLSLPGCNTEVHFLMC